jgi:hypothetical protein
MKFYLTVHLSMEHRQELNWEVRFEDETLAWADLALLFSCIGPYPGNVNHRFEQSADCEKSHVLAVLLEM